VSTLPEGQRMARVSSSDEQWLEFRSLARRKGRSVATYLGHLVQKELGRAERADARRSDRQSPAVRPGDADSEVSQGWIPPWEE